MKVSIMFDVEPGKLEAILEIVKGSVVVTDVDPGPKEEKPKEEKPKTTRRSAKKAEPKEEPKEEEKEEKPKGRRGSRGKKAVPAPKLSPEMNEALKAAHQVSDEIEDGDALVQEIIEEEFQKDHLSQLSDDQLKELVAILKVELEAPAEEE
jgi:hypothetical protein